MHKNSGEFDNELRLACLTEILWRSEGWQIPGLVSYLHRFSITTSFHFFYFRFAVLQLSKYQQACWKGGGRGGGARLPRFWPSPYCSPPQIFGPMYNSPLQIFRPCNMPVLLVKIRIFFSVCRLKKKSKQICVKNIHRFGIRIWWNYLISSS